MAGEFATWFDEYRQILEAQSEADSHRLLRRCSARVRMARAPGTMGHLTTLLPPDAPARTAGEGEGGV